MLPRDVPSPGKKQIAAEKHSWVREVLCRPRSRLGKRPDDALQVPQGWGGGQNKTSVSSWVSRHSWLNPAILSHCFLE